MDDVYFKKDIIYKFKNHILKFHIANTLFSSHDLDRGTDILLRHMTFEKEPQTILDMGCGYGPIGISLAKIFPKASIDMLDINLLAVRYAKLNIQENKVENIQVLGSVGMEKVLDKKFDVIVSNIPAKIGDNAIKQDFILTPIEHLTENGKLWIVVVSALNRLIPKVCRQYEIKFKEIKRRAGHTVYVMYK